jgi:ATP-dependent RNA helicase SUPV3L1/SUV3
MRARIASDALALKALSADEEIAAIATSRNAVRRLWDVCQIPDFRKLSADDHVRLVRTVFQFLSASAGTIPDDWLARQIARADVTEGDVATLSGRLAMIRTFTYAAHRPGWTRDAAHWQGLTRAVEDRLSDALHQALTQRFIDRRTSILMRHLRDDDFAPLALDESGGVSIGGEVLGRLDGFRFVPDPRARGNQARTLRAAARSGLESEIAVRITALSTAPDSAITLSEHGRLWWDGAIVARLTKGSSSMTPRIAMVADAHVQTAVPEQRLHAWLTRHIHERLGALEALRAAALARSGTPEAFDGSASGLARALAHQLVEGFGALDRTGLDLPPRLGPLITALHPYGVWFGRRHVYLPRLLRPDAAGLLTLLWGIWEGKDDLPTAPAPGLTSFSVNKGTDLHALRPAGFAVIGRRAIRFDMLERLESELEKAQAPGADGNSVLTRVISLMGASKEEGQAVLSALGWQLVPVQGAAAVWRQKPRTRPKVRGKNRPARARPQKMVNPDSPFAELARLVKRS